MNVDVFAVAGQIGSGKTTIAHVLGRCLHAPVVAFSSALRELAIESKLEPTRENLQDLGSNIVSAAPESLCTRVLQMAGSAGDLVLDGLRHKIVADTLATLIAPRRMAIVYVDAPEHLRRERVVAETGDDALHGWERHPSERYISELLPLADLVICNDRMPEDAEAQVRRWLSRIRKPSK